MCRTKSTRKIQDCHTITHPDISDHRIVRCQINFKFIRARKQDKPTPRFDTKKLQTVAISKQFAKNVSAALITTPNTKSSTVQDIADAIETALINTSNEMLKKQRAQQMPAWMSENTLHEIHTKHETRAAFGHTSIEYRLKRNLVKKLTKIDKEEHIKTRHIELSNLPPNARYHALIKELKLSDEKKVKSWGLKSKSGDVLSSVPEVLERWAEFYEELYSSDTASNSHFPEIDDIPEVTTPEIEHAISQLKTDKAPGPDGIVSEMFKHGGPVLQQRLLLLINSIIIKRETPTQTQLSEIITLYKKGDRLQCGNFRPISLLSHIYKLFMQVVYNRVSRDLIESLPKEQAAYQPGRNTIEQIQSLQQIIEKANEFQRNIVICFIDFTKAFDSVDQQKLWEALKQHTSINPAYINLISLLYKNSKTKIRTDVGITRLLELLKGVKQGDLLSALLFCVALMIILQNTLLDTNNGIIIGGEPHNNMGYADDIAIVAESLEEMNEILNRLQHFAEIFGLKINVAKTKIMLVGSHSTSTVPSIGNQTLDIVENFEYLGRTLSHDANDMPALINRINKAWGSFAKKKKLMTSNYISLRCKRTIYETYILPVALYATETMTWKSEMRQKIEVFHNNIMRWMTRTRLRDKVSIVRLYTKTNLKPLLPEVKRRKLKWYGHLRRSRLPVRTTVEGMVQGKRRSGRPNRRWRDDILEWCGPGCTWDLINSHVKDRKTWRESCDAIC